ncbi:hypothetical protein C8Q72DRAFT_99095 [Fomitopsis betulina]|nr:hypothetical protein C8Q72DRAFT_99095 [Fomitopsis betulina]
MSTFHGSREHLLEFIAQLQSHYDKVFPDRAEPGVFIFTAARPRRTQRSAIGCGRKVDFPPFSRTRQGVRLRRPSALGSGSRMKTSRSQRRTRTRKCSGSVAVEEGDGNSSDSEHEESVCSSCESSEARASRAITPLPRRSSPSTSRRTHHSQRVMRILPPMIRTTNGFPPIVFPCAIGHPPIPHSLYPTTSIPGVWSVATTRCQSPQRVFSTWRGRPQRSQGTSAWQVPWERRSRAGLARRGSRVWRPAMPPDQVPARARSVSGC